MPKTGKQTVLIIDDERIFCETACEYLERDGLEVFSASTGAEGLALCSRSRMDVVLLDQKLPDAEGHSLAQAILDRNDQTKIIFITAYPSFENAVRAVRTGAHDYLSKPVDPQEMKLAVENALRTLDLERVVLVHRYEKEKEKEGAVLVGSDGGLAEVARLVESAARTDSPALITGETGTGKNVVAKMVHFKSSRSQGEFVSINCAALPENLIEAELFGYEKGAFTGAAAAKKGLFEIAEGGTIFLDEIGEMPMHLQSKLLSVIEDRVIRRVGGTIPKPVNVRIIAATNADLEKAFGKTFRNDLYYRLSVLRIHIPPLRERRQDLPVLCAHLIGRIAGGRCFELPAPEIDRLASYHWPGNVRELRNVLERCLLVHTEGALQPSLLLERPASAPQSTAPAGSPQLDEIKTIEETEQQLIRFALARLSGNVTQTAKTLGISLSTLKRKIKEYGLK